MAFLGFLTYLFFFFIRPQDWWGPLMGTPVDYIIMSLIFISLIPSLSKFSDILKLPQGKFVLLFLVAVFLSNLVNGNIDASIEYGIRYLKYTIIFIAAILSVDSFRKFKWLVVYIILLVAFIAYQGIIQAKTGTNWAGQSLYWLDRIRWVGLFDGANILALAFVIVIPFLLEYFFGPWGTGYKIFAITTGSLILTAFYLTNSRGGFLSLLAVIFASILTRVKKKKGIVLGFIFVYVLLVFASPSRMGEIDDPTHSTRGRIHEWEEALEMVRYDNPIFGVGKGQFTQHTTLIAHNAFLQQLAETGLIGAFFWIGLVYATIAGQLEILKKENLDPLKQSLYRGYFVSFVGFLAGILFISSDNELVYVVMGLMSSLIVLEGISLRFTFRNLKVIGMIEIAGIIFTYAAVNIFKIIYF